MIHDNENPFWVQTPEDIPAEEALRLFVDIFTEFPQVETPSHSFIVGPRGSGKSMMFRMMRPDCLKLRTQGELCDLPYFSIYVAIKSTRITATEMQRLDAHPARYVFNEHLLCLYIAIAAFVELENATRHLKDEEDAKHLESWVSEVFCQRLNYSGVDADRAATPRLAAEKTVSGWFGFLAKYLDHGFWSEANQVLVRLGIQPEKLASYDGPLLTYHSFLFPLLASLQALRFLPKKPVYLLIDDADNLNQAQTEVINSWIATRTTSGVCLKLSDQMGYKTWLTYGGKRIQSPHDYNQVDVSVLYTTQRDRYLSRIEDIVRRRLQLANIDTAPRDFFPDDLDQAAKLQEIAREISEKWRAGEGVAARSRDDVTRYTRPELIRRLEGNRSTYSYSGFEQLAHISSGVVRYFLEPAAMMYSKQRTLSSPVKAITSRIQDEVIREFSDDFLDKDLAKMQRDAGDRASDYQRLLNLIDVLGNSFADRLLDEKLTERRVFSIALSDRADADVQRILDLGTKEGFLYRASLGAKRGSGRVPRYVLSRRLAPRFKLDPTSFAGYLFVTSQSLRKALDNPNHRLRESSVGTDGQLELELHNKS